MEVVGAAAFGCELQILQLNISGCTYMIDLRWDLQVGGCLCTAWMPVET